MFHKDDLKVGYVLQERSGVKLMVLPYKDGICAVDMNGCWNVPDDYNNDLTSADGLEGNDIVKVYGLADRASESREISIRFRSILWERKEEPLEITIDEIAKWKGVPSERIRIKE